MKVLLLTAHSIAEYDDLRMFTDLGIDVFSIGAYSDPSNPGDSLRPALPNAPDHPELRQLVIESREAHPAEEAEMRWVIDPAKAYLHPKIIDWADVIVCHHFLDRWIVPQFHKFGDKAVVWRTCGQSDPSLESLMGRFRPRLKIVRYSPRERIAFTQWGAFAGEDVLIRFGKYLFADFPGWIGDGGYVANVTQNMAGRGEAVGLSYWLDQTRGLNAQPAGPGSERLPGGVGTLSYDGLLDYLVHAGAYLYTGTAPASYTLGLIEAMAVGVPISTMPRERFAVPELWEADTLVGPSADVPVALWLQNKQAAAEHSQHMTTAASRLFDVETIGPQWVEFLGTLS